jgi:hypothetical protein
MGGNGLGMGTANCQLPTDTTAGQPQAVELSARLYDRVGVGDMQQGEQSVDGFAQVSGARVWFSAWARARAR